MSGSGCPIWARAIITTLCAAPISFLVGSFVFGPIALAAWSNDRDAVCIISPLDRGQSFREPPVPHVPEPAPPAGRRLLDSTSLPGQNHAKKMLLFLMTMGVVGTIVGVFVLGAIAYDVVIGSKHRRARQEMQPLMADDTSRIRLLDWSSWNLVDWSYADSLIIFLVIGLLLFVLVFITLGTVWTFGKDGRRCKEQVPDLWWHTQSYVVALWVCAAVTWCALAVIPSISITPLPRGGSQYGSDSLE